MISMARQRPLPLTLGPTQETCISRSVNAQKQNLSARLAQLTANYTVRKN